MNKKYLYMLILLFCIVSINSVKASWVETYIADPYTSDSESLTSEPGYPYGFMSSAYGYGIPGHGSSSIDTYANYDGKYIGDPVDPGDPYPPDTSDQLYEVSGSGAAVGQAFVGYEWSGGGGITPFCSHNKLLVNATLSGDADNGSLSTGTVSITSIGTAEVYCLLYPSTYLYKSMEFSGIKTYSESSSWVPDGLTLSIADVPSISLTWDDIAYWDDDFSDASFNATFYDPFFIDSFMIGYCATVQAEATSSNNAMNASVYIAAEAFPFEN